MGPARFAPLLALVCLGLAGAAAHAAPGRSGATPEALLEAAASSPEHARLTREPRARTEQALERARGAEESGDAARSRLLRELALTWARVARDLIRTAGAEKRADEAEKATHATEEKIVRARALLEETVARRGRAMKKLTEMEGDGPWARPGAGAEDEKDAASRGRRGTGPTPKTAPATEAR